MNIGVVGIPYLKLDSTIFFANLDHAVISTLSSRRYKQILDKSHVDLLNKKQVLEVIKQLKQDQKLEFTYNLTKTVIKSDFIYISVKEEYFNSERDTANAIAEVVKTVDKYNPVKQKVILVENFAVPGFYEELRSILDNKTHVIVHHLITELDRDKETGITYPKEITLGIPAFVYKPMGENLVATLTKRLYGNQVKINYTNFSTTESMYTTTKKVCT